MGKNNNKLSDLFLKSGEKKPMKWLFPVEIGMVLYAVFTLFVIFFTSTSLAYGWCIGCGLAGRWLLRVLFCFW